MTLSASDLIHLGDARLQVLTVPDDGLLLVHLAEATTPGMGASIHAAALRLADQLDIDPERVVILEPGVRFETLSGAQLRRLGLQRRDDAP